MSVSILSIVKVQDKTHESTGFNQHDGGGASHSGALEYFDDAYHFAYHLLIT